MYKDRAKNLFIYEFNNISELVKLLSNSTINTEVFGKKPSSITGDKSFTATDSFEQAIEMVTKDGRGYQQVLKTLAP